MAQQAQAQPAAQEAPRRREHTITFWANHVFTVDDGPPLARRCCSHSLLCH